MISDASGSEIPFSFDYDEVDPPRRVVLRFDDPPEQVTVTLADAPDGTDLTYGFVSWPAPADPDASRRGVDLIEAGIQRGIHLGCEDSGRTPACQRRPRISPPRRVIPSLPPLPGGRGRAHCGERSQRYLVFAAEISDAPPREE